jgi:hypothetical protein
MLYMQHLYAVYNTYMLCMCAMCRYAFGHADRMAGIREHYFRAPDSGFVLCAQGQVL